MPKCCYCNFQHEKLTKEHLVPKCKGGNNNPLNIKPCCVRCNKLRGHKSLQFWLLEIITNENGLYPKKEKMIPRIKKYIKYIERHGINLYDKQKLEIYNGEHN